MCREDYSHSVSSHTFAVKPAVKIYRYYDY